MVCISFADASEVKLKYDRGFSFETADERFSLKASAFLQTRAVADSRGGQGNLFMSVRRAWLYLSGHAYSPKLKYLFVYSFDSSLLITGYADYEFTKNFSSRTGVFLLPYNLESLSSARDLQLTERSLAQTLFGVPGIIEYAAGAHGTLFNRLDYQAYVSNGERGNNGNINDEFRFLLRMAFHIQGNSSLAKVSQWQRALEPSVSLAFAGMYNDTPNELMTGEQKVYSATTELNAKSGRWTGNGAYFFKQISPDVGNSTIDHGLYLQAGYLLVENKVEVALRGVHALMESGNDQSEYTAGMNFFLFNAGQMAKIQMDYSLLWEDVVSDSIGHRARIQFQFTI